MMFRHYSVRLGLRALALGAIIYLYAARRDVLLSLLAFRSLPAYLIWAVLMAGILWHFLPHSRLSMAGRKQFEQNYLPKAYRREDLTVFIKKSNRRAARVMLLWLAAHALIFWLYAQNIIGAAELLLLSACYFVGDLVCILLFCPFQRWLMHSRCCVNCRIFDWGHFMMYTPLLPLGGFFARSLAIGGCLLLLCWEINLARHPERFWNGSNAAIACADCSAGLCRIKKRHLDSAA